MIDYRRDEVVKSSPPEKGGISSGRGVLQSQPLHLPEQFAFSKRFRQIQRTVETNGGGNFRKEVRHGIDSDRFQHLSDILLGMGNVTHDKLQGKSG
jgi:hypothetical protein